MDSLSRTLTFYIALARIPMNTSVIRTTSRSSRYWRTTGSAETRAKAHLACTHRMGDIYLWELGIRFSLHRISNTNLWIRQSHTRCGVGLILLRFPILLSPPLSSFGLVEAFRDKFQEGSAFGRRVQDSWKWRPIYWQKEWMQTRRSNHLRCGQWQSFLVWIHQKSRPVRFADDGVLQVVAEQQKPLGFNKTEDASRYYRYFAIHD